MATKKDATGESTSFEFGGDTYNIPPAEEWDIDVLEAIDDQKLTHAIKALVGDEQYALFRKSNRTVKALGEFMQAATEAAGSGN
ncbi:hypothetical protein [Streptomyces malaysiensis]